MSCGELAMRTFDTKAAEPVVGTGQLLPLIKTSGTTAPKPRPMSSLADAALFCVSPYTKRPTQRVTTAR